MSLVSVVIPTYNRPKYLARAIDSVLNQSYEDIEIIVVDDNNPDTEARTETIAVMEEYKNNDKVSYIKHSHNKRGSAARNTGWRAANGEFITFLDDDDEIAVNKIAKQVECLKKLDSSWGCCYTAYKLIKGNGRNQISSECRSGQLYVEALMRTLFMGSGSNLMLRKSVVDKINGYDESFIRNQDIEFMVRVLEEYKIAYIDEPLLIIHQDGKRPSYTFDQLEGYTRHYMKKMENRINSLPVKDRKRVRNVIALERVRVAIQMHEIKKALVIIQKERVDMCSIFKYILYIFKRIVTGKSYGFSLK